MIPSKERLRTVIDRYVAPVSCLRGDWTVEETIVFLRCHPVEEQPAHFYVVDDKGCLVGTISPRTLLLSEADTPLQELMKQNPVHLSSGMLIRDALHVFTDHRFLALPVLNDGGKCVGSLGLYRCLEEVELITNLESNHGSREEIFQLVGVSMEEETSPRWKRIAGRIPWLSVNIFGGIISAYVTEVHSEVLGSFIVLAMFIPLVLGMSESIAMQAMTFTLQSMQTQALQSKLFARSVANALSESWTSAGVALFYACIVGAVVFFWEEGWMPAFVVLGSIFLSSSFVAFLASALPRLLRYFYLDPKVASGPIVLMLADIVTIAVYLSLASAVLLTR